MFCAEAVFFLKPRAKRSAPASLAPSVPKPCARSRLRHLIMSSRRDRGEGNRRGGKKSEGEREGVRERKRRGRHREGVGEGLGTERRRERGEGEGGERVRKSYAPNYDAPPLTTTL